MHVSSATFDRAEHPNIQMAFDAMQASTATWTLVGLPAEIEHYGTGLGSIVAGQYNGPPIGGAVSFTEVAIGVEATMPCLSNSLFLGEWDGEPFIASFIRPLSQGPNPEFRVEVMTVDVGTGRGFLATLRRLMSELNVYRGKVLTFSFGQYGDFGIEFHSLPTVTRDQVILPDGTLAAIERHALGVTQHADQLRRDGQHLRRGLLLFGPPGTGKSHTVAYVCNESPDRTVIILTGGAAGAVGQAGSIARTLEPATIVIEDVDLIASDRSMHGGRHNTVLFQLLNEMDGIAADGDVLFVLTTNQVDSLETALAARPGRIDQAIELPLPDAAARGRLLELYSAGLDIPREVASRIVDQTEGCAGAFMKELVRRAALLAAEQETSVAASLEPALGELHQHSTPIMRMSLGMSEPERPEAGRGHTAV